MRVKIRNEKRNVGLKQQERVKVHKEGRKETERANKQGQCPNISMQIRSKGRSQLQRVAGLSGGRYFSLGSNRLAVTVTLRNLP
jgi:hypothetical protein